MLLTPAIKGLIILIITALSCSDAVHTYPEIRVHTFYLAKPGKVYSDRHEPVPVRQVMCYPGVEKTLLNFWQTVAMELSLSLDQIEGRTAEEVFLEFHRSAQMSARPVTRRDDKYVSLDPFNPKCIGVLLFDVDFNVTLHVSSVGYWGPMAVLAGMSLYILSDLLCGNQILFYVCGVILGICTSGLFLVYLLIRNIPPAILIWYVFIIGLISFLLCHRFGPIVDARTKTIVKWTLRAFSLILMYYSSPHRLDASRMIIAIFLGYQHSPYKPRFLKAIDAKFSRVLFRLQLLVDGWLGRGPEYPPQVPLLTEEQYEEQRINSTQQSVEELRAYCLGPNAGDAWDTVLSLKDPKRFVRFVYGEPHVNEQEQRLNLENPGGFLTDDDSD